MFIAIVFLTPMNQANHSSLVSFHFALLCLFWFVRLALPCLAVVDSCGCCCCSIALDDAVDPVVPVAVDGAVFAWLALLCFALLCLLCLLCLLALQCVALLALLRFA